MDESSPSTPWSALPALVVETDPSGRITALHGEWSAHLPQEVGALDDISIVFSKPAAIFLETHLWPLLRREGRFDECHVTVRVDGDEVLPCLVNARWRGNGDARRAIWLFFPARERARFEAELIAARELAQRLARELAEANRRLAAVAQTAEARSQELDRLAHTDPLTGLGNRRALDAAFSATASDKGALLLVDADRFKAINDRWGHQVGDEVLVELATALRQCVRRSDTAIRLGGEEFAIFLPGSDALVAERVAAAVHSRVAGIKLPDGSGGVSVSIGVTRYRGTSGDALVEAIQRADAALYDAKNAGRGCTRWSDGDAADR